MLKSTAGTWVNYLTTALFQVLFARRFGSTADASAYALTFNIAVGLAAIVVGTTQSIYIPRMLTPSEALLTTVVGRMARLTLIALLVFGGLAAAASVLAPVIAPKINRPGTHFVELVRLAALFGFSQVLVGQLAAVSWARGSRFLPAVSPAIPSIIALVPLAHGHAATTATLYELLTAGSLLQVVVLTAAAEKRLVFSGDKLDPLGKLTVAWFGAFAAAQLIVPFEVFIAAHASASGGAEFNYAYRAIAVAQALIVGGVVSAALPDWSTHVRHNARLMLERSIAQTISAAALALFLAAAIGLVASKTLVQVAFQRGTFTAHDTHVVSQIVSAALVGFVAEGIMLVLGQALIADRRSRLAIGLSAARTVGVIVLVLALGLMIGPVGVALGYSGASLVAVVGQLLFMYREGMLTNRQSRLARSTGLVALCTGAAAAMLPLHVPVLLRMALVIVVFVTVLVPLRDGLPRLRMPLS
jgi:putative peptidoglycan lipid II flippase